MEIPILMDAIAAGVTLAAVAVALYFGVKSLRQTRDIQRARESKNNDIEERAKQYILIEGT